MGRAGESGASTFSQWYAVRASESEYVFAHNSDPFLNLLLYTVTYTCAIPIGIAKGPVRSSLFLKKME